MTVGVGGASEHLFKIYRRRPLSDIRISSHRSAAVYSLTPSTVPNPPDRSLDPEYHHYDSPPPAVPSPTEGGTASIQTGQLRLDQEGDARATGSQPATSTRTLTVKYQSGTSLQLKSSSSEETKYKKIKSHYKATHGGKAMPFAARHALRPRPDARIDQASVQNMHEALADNQSTDLQKHVLHPEKNRLVNDARYIFKEIKEEQIGEGSFNKVYKKDFKPVKTSSVSAFFGIRTVKHRVIKESKDALYKGGATTQTRGGGIDAQYPRMPDRNEAASKVDQFLGTSCVPRASAGIFNGKSCVAMSVAPGTTAKNIYREHPEIILNGDFQRQMSNLEVNAFLSANPDPHMENIMVDYKIKQRNGKEHIEVKVTLVDNDTCHGPKMTNPDCPEIFNIPGKDFSQYRSTGLPAYIEATTAKNIMKLNPNDCAIGLMKNLNPAEINAFKSRLNLLQEHVKFLQVEGRIVADWTKFTDEAGHPCKGGNFIDGTLMMPGVQQGTMRNGEPLIMPRSSILRDIKEIHLGKHHRPLEAKADFKKQITEAFSENDRGLSMYTRIIGNSACDIRMMPPSGNKELSSYFSSMTDTPVPSASDEANDINYA